MAEETHLSQKGHTRQGPGQGRGSQKGSVRTRKAFRLTRQRLNVNLDE